MNLPHVLPCFTKSSGTTIQKDGTKQAVEISMMLAQNCTVAIYSFGHRLHTVTAVSRSTERSTFRMMVKLVPAKGRKLVPAAWR